jgi:hypothetical protein
MTAIGWLLTVIAVLGSAVVMSLLGQFARDGIIFWLWLAGVLAVLVLPVVLTGLTGWQERRSLRAYRRRELLNSAAVRAREGR